MSKTYLFSFQGPMKRHKKSLVVDKVIDSDESISNNTIE